VSALIFGGYLLRKFPEHSKEILDFINEENRSGGNQLTVDIHMYKDLEFLGWDDEIDTDKLYLTFIEFANQTEHIKRRVNQVLIQIDEYYNEEYKED